jgi:hypothetical protein
LRRHEDDQSRMRAAFDTGLNTVIAGLRAQLADL